MAAAVWLSIPASASAQISVGRSDWNVSGNIPAAELQIVEQQLGEVAASANLKLVSIGLCPETACTTVSLASGLSRYLYLELQDAEDRGMRVRFRVVDALNSRPLATRSVFIQKNDRRGTRSALEVTVRDVAFHLFGPPVPDSLRADAARKAGSSPAAPAAPQPSWAGSPPQQPDVVKPAPEPEVIPVRAEAVREPAPEPVRARPVIRETAPPPPEPAPEPVYAAPPAPEPEPEPEPQQEMAPSTPPASTDTIIPDKIDIPYLP